MDQKFHKFNKNLMTKINNWKTIKNKIIDKKTF